MSTETKKVSGLGAAAILTLYLISMGAMVITPAMATFAAHFEGKNVAWFSTLPTLFVVVGTFISGKVMGKKMKYRTLTILATLLYLIGGCAPAFFDNYALTLVCRAILGVGLGMLSPLGSALIIGLYKGQKQASMLGYGTLCMNAGGIVLQMVGGALAEINWQLVFFGHAFCLLGLIMAFFLPEPEAPAPEAAVEAGPKEKMSKAVYGIAILFCLFNILNYPIMMNISTLFVERGAGTATNAATSLSLYTVAGCVAGLVFGKIFQFAKKWSISLGYLLCGLGALVLYVGSNQLIMTIGMMMIGFGFSIIMPAFLAWVGLATPASTVAAATSLVMALMNLGGFISTFWLNLLSATVGDSLYTPIIVEIVVFLITAVVFLFYNPFKEK